MAGKDAKGLHCVLAVPENVLRGQAKRRCSLVPHLQRFGCSALRSCRCNGEIQQPSAGDFQVLMAGTNDLTRYFPTAAAARNDVLVNGAIAEWISNSTAASVAEVSRQLQPLLSTKGVLFSLPKFLSLSLVSRYRLCSSLVSLSRLLLLLASDPENIGVLACRS